MLATLMLSCGTCSRLARGCFRLMSSHQTSAGALALRGRPRPRFGMDADVAAAGVLDDVPALSVGADAGAAAGAFGAARRSSHA